MLVIDIRAFFVPLLVQASVVSFRQVHCLRVTKDVSACMLARQARVELEESGPIVIARRLQWDAAANVRAAPASEPPHVPVSSEIIWCKFLDGACAVVCGAYVAFLWVSVRA